MSPEVAMSLLGSQEDREEREKIKGRDNRDLSPGKVTVLVYHGIVSHDFISPLKSVGCSSASCDFGWYHHHPGT